MRNIVQEIAITIFHFDIWKKEKVQKHWNVIQLIFVFLYWISFLFYSNESQMLSGLLLKCWNLMNNVYVVRAHCRCSDDVRLKKWKSWTFFLCGLNFEVKIDGEKVLICIEIYSLRKKKNTFSKRLKKWNTEP